MNFNNINFTQLATQLANKAKALALNVSDIELKVLEATNEEPWGPHATAMREIARAAEDPEKYSEYARLEPGDCLSRLRQTCRDDVLPSSSEDCVSSELGWPWLADPPDY
jgi:hypothetical protein